MRGGVVISSFGYSYQGTIRNSNTGILHAFGYPREEPKRWRWVSIHPSSLDLHIQRALQELEQMKAGHAK